MVGPPQAGPALGGVLGEIHIRLPFFAAAALTALNCAYGYFLLPESLPGRPNESAQSQTLVRA